MAYGSRAGMVPPGHCPAVPAVSFPAAGCSGRSFSRVYSSCSLVPLYVLTPLYRLHVHCIDWTIPLLDYRPAFPEILSGGTGTAAGGQVLRQADAAIRQLQVER